MQYLATHTAVPDKQESYYNIKSMAIPLAMCDWTQCR